MSDVPDWTGVSAGATSVVASGSGLVVASGGFFTPPDFTVPQTTRSLLIILLCTNAPAGGVTPQGATIEGNTSLQIWQSPQVLPQLDTAFHTNTAAEPIYSPFYGAVDKTGHFSFGITGGPSTWSYWILALPDADILGTTVDPMVVTTLGGTQPGPTKGTWALSTGGAAATLLTVPEGSTYRLWNAWLSAGTSNASSYAQGFLEVGGQVLWGVGCGPNNAVQTDATAFEAGVPILGGVGGTAVTLNPSGSLVTLAGGITYST